MKGKLALHYVLKEVILSRLHENIFKMYIDLLVRKEQRCALVLQIPKTKILNEIKKKFIKVVLRTKLDKQCTRLLFFLISKIAYFKRASVNGRRIKE